MYNTWSVPSTDSPDHILGWTACVARGAPGGYLPVAHHQLQPIVALALKVRDLGHEVRLCVPPNFVEWVRGFGFEAVPVGVEMRHPGTRSGTAPLTEEQIRRIRESMPDLITDQFDVISAAAEGCDVILGANAHQYAARSIAELRRVPYVTALYAPVAIPSPDHSPPPPPGEKWGPGDAATNAQRWADNVRAWNNRALDRVNHNRSQRGLAPIDDVLRHNITDHPWLATDAALAPVPTAPGTEIFQTSSLDSGGLDSFGTGDRRVSREGRAADLSRLRQHARPGGRQSHPCRGSACRRAPGDPIAGLGGATTRSTALSSEKSTRRLSSRAWQR